MSMLFFASALNLAHKPLIALADHIRHVHQDMLKQRPIASRMLRK
jgi:hypothetical protein